MRYVSTAVIVILTAVMAVYVVVQGKTGRKKSGREDRVFPGFDVKKASRVVIERPDGKLELVRKNGAWMLTSPSPFPADSDAVETLLSDMEMLRFTRKLDGGDGAVAQYGLDKPRVVVRVDGALPGSAPAVLKIGATDVTGASLYVQSGRSRDVLIVDKGIASSADKGIESWRGKEAFLLGSADRIKEVSYRIAAQSVRIMEKGENRVLVDAAGKVLCRAQRDSVDDLWRRVADLRVTRFQSSGGKALSKAKLDRGWIEVTEAVLAGAKGKTGKSTKHRLLLGGTCRVGNKTYDNERLVGRPAESGFPEAVFCVKAKELDAILRPESELRDIKLLSFQGDSLRRLEIQSGNRRLVLVKDEDTWKIDEPKSSKGGKLQSDGQLVAKFVDDVQAFSVLGFVFPGQQGTAGYGLDKPQGSLRLENQDGLSEILELGKVDGDKVYVRRKGESAVLVVHRELTDLIKPDPLMFKDRQVLSLDQSSIKEIIVQQATTTESLVQKDGHWRLSKPLDLEADQDAVDAFIRALSSLRADRYLGRETGGVFVGPEVRVIKFLAHEEPDDLSLHGADRKPEAHKDASKDRWRTLRLGPVSAKGCLGRVEDRDRVVFALPMATCRDLHAWLADRRLADVTPSSVAKVRFVGPKGQWELEKRGPQWYSKAGPKVDNTSVETLLTTIQGLRASRTVRYGKPGKQEGFSKPYITVTLTTQKGKTISIVIGDEVQDKDGKVSGRYCWRPDRDVVYVLPAFSVSDLEKTSL